MSMTHALHKEEKEVNLLVYPTKNSDLILDEGYQLTLGDLHGNALKLLNTLIKHHVMDLDEKSYTDFADVYIKKTEDLMPDDMKKFNSILEKITFNPRAKDFFIRLIGDELADRGSNDYFTL